MTNSCEDIGAALQAFYAADARWSAELHKAFGDAAGNMRYTPEGEGEPGSDLAAAYLAFRSARIAWEARIAGR